MNHQKSHEIFSAAQAMMPGGVNSPARAFGAVGGEPIVIASGSGAYLKDVDGNQYIDYIGSWGPMILGHARPQVIGAIQQAAIRGTSFGAPTEAENVLAAMIIDAVESIEKIRLVNSGTEATMSAIRVARGFTGRDLIVKFSGNYHGHVDSLLVAAGSSAATLSVPDSPGVTQGTTKDTIILAYNDIEQLKNAFEQYERRIAAVIIEPVVGNMGCVIPSEEFLSHLRSITEQQGTLLIYDEVMTGFRVAYGGAQSLQQIRPDLTTLGKIVGGGLPLGAYGGRADVMNYVLPAGKVFQAGTLSGNPIATAAGIATLQQLRDEPPYEYLESISARLAEGLLAAAAAAGFPHSFARVGSMMTLFFNPGPVSNWDTSSQSNLDRFARYFWGLANRGIYMPCSQFEALFVSAAHTTEDIETTIQAARETMAEID